jgi:hypothetical protein
MTVPFSATRWTTTVGSQSRDPSSVVGSFEPGVGVSSARNRVIALVRSNSRTSPDWAFTNAT